MKMLQTTSISRFDFISKENFNFRFSERYKYVVGALYHLRGWERIDYSHITEKQFNKARDKAYLCSSNIIQNRNLYYCEGELDEDTDIIYVYIYNYMEDDKKDIKKCFLELKKKKNGKWKLVGLRAHMKDYVFDYECGIFFGGTVTWEKIVTNNFGPFRGEVYYMPEKNKKDKLKYSQYEQLKDMINFSVLTNKNFLKDYCEVVNVNFYCAVHLHRYIPKQKKIKNPSPIVRSWAKSNILEPKLAIMIYQYIK